MAKLNSIRLELARDHDFPEGSRMRGYELIAPLDDKWHLDEEAWKTLRGRCKVKRFWAGEANEIGHLVHRRGQWFFDYDPERESDDEPGYKLDKHVFRPGEYISIREHGGVMRTFRIASVVELE